MLLGTSLTGYSPVPFDASPHASDDKNGYECFWSKWWKIFCGDIGGKAGNGSSVCEFIDQVNGSESGPTKYQHGNGIFERTFDYIFEETGDISHIKATPNADLGYSKAVFHRISPHNSRR